MGMLEIDGWLRIATRRYDIRLCRRGSDTEARGEKAEPNARHSCHGLSEVSVVMFQVLEYCLSCRILFFLTSVFREHKNWSLIKRDIIRYITLS